MTAENREILVKYIQYLYSSSMNKPYRSIGVAIKYVSDYLEINNEISKRTYLQYRKIHAAELARNSCAINELCEFLSWKGVGYKVQKKNIKALEKLSVISEKNQKSINDFVYFLQNENDYSANTVDVYKTSITKFFEYASELSMDNVKRYIKTLEEQKFSAKTINLRITGVERYAKWVKKPLEIKRPKMKAKLDTDNIPTEAEYNKLLEYLKNKNMDQYYIIKILATTGARISEFLQLKWDDIISGEVTLKGKGNKYRRFFFSRSLQSEVKKYVSDNNKSGLVAVTRCGNPMTQRNINGQMKIWAKYCNIDEKKMHPHAFRHFFAKMFLKKNKDIIQLADLLGHGSIDTTRIYLQKSYDEQKREFNKSVTW